MNKETYHFVGLGGIGMSALARVLLQRGANVQGSDEKESALLTELRQEGATIEIGHHGNVAGATRVIYSTDIPSKNVDLTVAKERQIPLLHRSDLLHLLMQDRAPLLVTGTHGKTTTTALLASVLEEAQLAPSFVIGGIHQKWKTNGRAGMGNYFVAEADESDGSFLKTPSFGAIVTNLGNDHLNYWKEAHLLDAAFGDFFAQAKHPEHLFWCGDDARLRALNPKGISYGFNRDNDLCIQARPIETGICFDVHWNGKSYREIQLSLYGQHNALNGAAVFGLALSLGVAESVIRQAFIDFAGTARRLEWKGTAQGVDIYDDYGHHPTEISTTLAGLRHKIRERRLIALFQPHRFTRVRDLFDQFWTSFSEADVVIMTDIYGAGEAPIEGIYSELLYAQMKEKLGDKLLFIERQRLEETVASLLNPHDVVVTLGAGDITTAGSKILNRIKENPESVKLTVGLLFGGTSSEHAVSLMSARTFIETIDRRLYNVKLFGLTKEGEWLIGDDALDQLEHHLAQKIVLPLGTPKLTAEALQELTSCDVTIPIFHGQQGEDGMIQGLLDALDICHVGSDYRSAALCMHKGWTKQIAISAGIPTSRFVEMDKATYTKNPQLLIEKITSYPVWIKPVHLGSSIGITRVTSSEDVHAAAAAAFALDDTLIADQEIVGREIEFSLLGNEFIRVAPPGEIIKPDLFHSYDKKYGAGASHIECPAPITPEQERIGRQLAIDLYKRASCKGLARIDFFLDNAGHFWVNEINPIQGFKKTIAYTQACAVEVFSIQKICNDLIILAMQRSRKLTQIRGK